MKWQTEFYYGMTIRGRVKFRIKNYVEKYKEQPDLFLYIWEELKSATGMINICIMVCAFCQASIIIYRLYYGYKSLMLIKKKLEEDEEAFGAKYENERKEVVSCSDVDSIYIKGKTKWEMLKLNEKKNFFNLWYVLMLIANFIQILSSINHLAFPIISHKNEFYCALSCLLTYISCGYFFEYEERYYFFYLTMKKSFLTHSKYFFVFGILFIGLGVFMCCTFHYSEKFYTNIHMSFITLFASIFGDTLYDIWNSTLEKNPVTTVICAVFFFLVFNAFLMKMLVTITEESFDCIKMRKNYYWLDKKLSVKDYIKNEVVLRDEECDQNELGQHYMMSDILLEIILNANNLTETIDKLNIENAIKLDNDKLESEGVFKDEVVKMIKKKFRQSIKYESFKEADHFEKNDDLNNETKKIKGVYKFIDNVFEKINSSLKKINNIIEGDRGDFEELDRKEMSRINIKLYGYANNIDQYLNSIRKILNN